MSAFVLQSSAQGTVPYLGIFLTDLTMLDAAVKDRLEVRINTESKNYTLKTNNTIKNVLNIVPPPQNGYINFDKRRRVSFNSRYYLLA